MSGKMAAPAAPPMLRKQASDVSRGSDAPNMCNDDEQHAISRAVSGTLAACSKEVRIVFLDIDGVLAPRLNAGQIVKQCVDGVVALCRASGAKIVLTSSWRLLPGKPQLFEKLLEEHHASAGLIFDATPCLESVPESDSHGMTNTALLGGSAKFVRIHERAGLDADGAVAALRLLTLGDEPSPVSAAGLEAIFCDPEYDLHVFSESTSEYSRACFSPRSREGSDWSHDPCTAHFARTRCREIACWLEAAASCGVVVSHWAVLDDDDLLQTGDPPRLPVRRLPEQRMVVPSPGQKACGAAASGPSGAAVAEVAAVPVASLPAAAAAGGDEDDMGWEFAF